MRKKSHIALAGYLTDALPPDTLRLHKKSFYIGSILPDCKPSFITTRHEYNITGDFLKERVAKLLERFRADSVFTCTYIRHVGEILHYIADYFTFPHNDSFTGTFREHCSYERMLKYKLRLYIKRQPVAADTDYFTFQEFHSKEELFAYLSAVHSEYMNKRGNVLNDCRYIVRVCLQVAYTLMNPFTLNKQPVLV